MHSLGCQLMVRISSLSAFSRLASPLTVIVSRGFAARAGRFLLAENIPYMEERPGGWLCHPTSDGVQIPQNSKKWPQPLF